MGINIDLYIYIKSNSSRQLDPKLISEIYKKIQWIKKNIIGMVWRKEGYLRFGPEFYIFY